MTTRTFRISRQPAKILSSALLALTCYLCATSLLAEETRYISDSVYIPLRSGQGTQFRIRMNLKTGEKLDVQEVSADKAWVRVITQGGTEGWIEAEYLSYEPPARQQLETVLQKNTQLKQQFDELKQKNNELTSSVAELNRNVGNESTARGALAEELTRIKQLSANTIALDQRARELAEQNKVLSAGQEKLARENNKLKEDQRTEFMMYGAGLLLSGVLLAIILPALKPKKRRSEWS